LLECVNCDNVIYKKKIKSVPPMYYSAAVNNSGLTQITVLKNKLNWLAK